MEVLRYRKKSLFFSFCFVYFFFYIIFFEFPEKVNAIKWLALRDEQNASRTRCQSLRISPCAALPHVTAAARSASSTCQELLSGRRWNCSTITKAPDYGPDLLLGTKEQSFVYALSSAALMYTMAKACSSGSLFSCTCGRTPRERPTGNFQWGGCSDNLKWASRFVRQFLETPERGDHYVKEPIAPPKEPKQIHIYDTKDRLIDKDGNLIETTTFIPETDQNLNGFDGDDMQNTEQHKINGNSSKIDQPIVISGIEKQQTFGNSTINGEATLVRRDSGKKGKKKKNLLRNGGHYNMVGDHEEFDRVALERKLEKLQPYIALANLQNSRIGRKLVESSLSVSCKCHGVSGSCSVRTCWRSLGALTSLGAQLRARVATAAPLRARARAAGAAARNSLVFVTRSPDYCRKDGGTGSLGTSGRWCNATLRSGSTSCRHLCCGRGHVTVLSQSLNRCHCRYIWCCRVECDVCKITIKNHYCN